MAIESIITELTKKHYKKSIKFHVFDEHHRKTDAIVEKKISDYFDEKQWENGLRMLERIQVFGAQKSEKCFDDFWASFLVGVKSDISSSKALVRGNVLNFESYLRFMLVRLGFAEDVRRIQQDGKGLRLVIDLATKKANMFKSPGESSNIMETIACYRNWWGHFPTNTSDEGADELRYNLLEIPFEDDEEVDFPLLGGMVRLILVELLLIVLDKYDSISQSIPQFSSVITPELQFEESIFLDIYINYLQEKIENKLQKEAIQELIKANGTGYFEHSFRFSHSNKSDEDSTDEIDGESEQRIRLGLFRRNSKYKTNIILGMPGAGKTTALYLLIDDCIRQYNKLREDERGDAVIPILIPFKSISLQKDSDAIRTSIREQISYSIPDKDNKYREDAFKCVYNLISEGRIALFFDGLNEIAPECRNAIISSLKNAIELMPDDSKVFITGREYEYEGSSYAKEFKSIDDLAIWHLEELSYEQIEEFLSPQILSQITNEDNYYHDGERNNKGTIIELLSSPLILKLFLDYAYRHQVNKTGGSLVVPLNRGEILESFLTDSIKSNDINPNVAIRLLKFIAAHSIGGHACDKFALTQSIEGIPSNVIEGIIDKLASINVLLVSPAREDTPEQVSFFIDTFQEFYRAKGIIDKLIENKALSLYEMRDNDCAIDPDSDDDYETLKLVFEIGSSPFCHQKRDNSLSGDTMKNVARSRAIEFSARLAKDYLNPKDVFDKQNKLNTFDSSADYKVGINARLSVLCNLVRNVPFSRDIDFAVQGDKKEQGAINAKDLAELLVLNNLKWFRVKHPDTITLDKYSKEYSYLDALLTASAIVGGKQIWDEIITSYWLFTFGIISPYDYSQCADAVDLKEEVDRRSRRFVSSYTLLFHLVSQCRDYIYLYSIIHKLHIYHIKNKNSLSAFGISAFLYQDFLCFLPNYAKKHLYNHISEKYSKNADDKQLATDINTLLCYIGDSQLLSDSFKYESDCLIRIKELRYILRNYADTITQRFVLSNEFFRRLQGIDKSSNENLKSLTIRFFLFRLGLTPIMRDFLFCKGGLSHIPQDEIEAIMDLIPLQSIPKEYIDKHYDKGIYELLIKENGNEISGTEIEYVYFGEKDDSSLVSILDVEDTSFVGQECFIGNEAYSIIDDKYIDAVRLYCKVTACTEKNVLLPEKGVIVPSDNVSAISYCAASPNTELSFYLYGEDAVALLFLVNDRNKLFINDIECKICFPEHDKHSLLSYRHFRILEIRKKDNTLSDLPYSGELKMVNNINKVCRTNVYLNTPERFESLVDNLNLKTGDIDYKVFGQNKSLLWVITEKIVTSADTLVGHDVFDGESHLPYRVRSIKPHNTPYMEFWFKVSQKVSIPAYGSFSCQNLQGGYASIPFCFNTKSEDGMSIKLRVFDEVVSDIPLKELYNDIYLFGNIPLQLISVEKIIPNRRYSIWTLQKTEGDSVQNKGTMYFRKGKQQKTKNIITFSGETRSTIKELNCTFCNYDKATGKLSFIAKKPVGTIGAGAGDLNLLKGLYLNNPYISSTRLPIDRDSEVNIKWLRRYHIRCDINVEKNKGFFILDGIRINFIKEDSDHYWLWCPSDSEFTDVEDSLSAIKLIHLCFDDGSEEDYSVLESMEDKEMRDYSLIIQSHCSMPLSDSEIEKYKTGGMISFNLQAAAPVLNSSVFPHSFRALYPRQAINYKRDIKHEGVIIVPKPVSVICADSVKMDNLSRWEIQDITTIGKTHLKITLRDKDGRTPILDAYGLVKFISNGTPITLWYNHLYDLIDQTHPEKYHAELCGNIFEEVLSGDTELDSDIVDFFVKKSRASDLVTNAHLLDMIEKKELSRSMFNVCRVLKSHPLRGLEAYSALQKKKVLSSDTMLESHNGRPFAWQDLVLMERNHRLTLVNDLPRYHCLGYKTGFVTAVSTARFGPRNVDGRKRVEIYSDEHRETYFFFYDARNSSTVFSPGDDVDFFATINYNDGGKLAAENARLLGTKQQIIEARYIGQFRTDEHVVFAFEKDDEKLEIRINAKNNKKIEKYTSLRVGESYQIIRGKRLFIVEK